MDEFKAIDEAVDLLMDHYLRPHFKIEHTDQGLDDDIYNYVHILVHELIDNVKRTFENL